MHPHVVSVSAFSWCCASESERIAGLPVTGRRSRESLSAARRGESDMASAGQKIKLSPSRDIPFNKLVLSQSNVRRVKAGVSIEQLAESIAQRTLLQSLSVRAVVDADSQETGMFEVPAGGRRYRALELLVKQRRMAKTQPVPCVVRVGGIAEDENFVQIVVLLFAWIVVLLAFFILAIQLFVTLIEFKLTTLAGFVLIPFGLFGKTAFAAERVLGNVISSGVKVLVLAVIVGIGSTLFSQFTTGFGGNQPTIESAMSMVLAALSLLGLGIFGPGIANGIVSGGPQLGAGAAIGTGVAAGGVVAAGVAGVGLAAGAAGGALAGASRGSASVVAAASNTASPLPRTAGTAASSAGELGQGAASSGSPSAVAPPAWATRMKRAQTMGHGASAATHSVRSADHAGGGSSVDLSEGES
jgi:P-type conjugative transfer protein TrbL